MSAFHCRAGAGVSVFIRAVHRKNVLGKINSAVLARRAQVNSSVRAHMKISTIVLLASTLFSGASFAEAPVDTHQLEKNKAKIVSRLYQATYGQVERCKKATPDAAAEFQNELTRFVEINGNLIKQVVQSPYYEPARQKFSKHEAVDPVRDTPEKLGGECGYLVQLLRSMNDTPEGKKAVKEYEVLLAK